MAGGRIPMTREGYDRKKIELDRLRNFEMTEIAKRIAIARDLGDLSENAEYHAAREDQGMLQARIDGLTEELALAEIVDPTTLSTETVVFWSSARLMDLNENKEIVFTLVGPGDEDPEKRKILTTSPRGKGLIGRRRGEVVEIVVPKGTLRYKIIDIFFDR